MVLQVEWVCVWVWVGGVLMVELNGCGSANGKREVIREKRLLCGSPSGGRSRGSQPPHPAHLSSSAQQAAPRQDKQNAHPSISLLLSFSHSVCLLYSIVFSLHLMLFVLCYFSFPLSSSFIPLSSSLHLIHHNLVQIHRASFFSRPPSIPSFSATFPFSFPPSLLLPSPVGFYFPLLSVPLCLFIFSPIIIHPDSSPSSFLSPPPPTSVLVLLWVCLYLHCGTIASDPVSKV